MSLNARRYASRKGCFHEAHVCDMGEGASMVEEAMDMLLKYGVSEAAGLSLQNAVDLQLLAEMVNLMAKSGDWELGESYGFFYSYKAPLIKAALEAGAEGGWGDDGCFFLSTPQGGVNCFHDPYGELECLLTPEQNALRWEHGWSGIYRQDEAIELAKSRQSDGKLLKFYAQVTHPERDFMIEDFYSFRQEWLEAA